MPSLPSSSSSEPASEHGLVESCRTSSKPAGLTSSKWLLCRSGPMAAQMTSKKAQMADKTAMTGPYACTCLPALLVTRCFSAIAWMICADGAEIEAPIWKLKPATTARNLGEASSLRWIGSMLRKEKSQFFSSSSDLPRAGAASPSQSLNAEDKESVNTTTF